MSRLRRQPNMLLWSVWSLVIIGWVNRATHKFCNADHYSLDNIDAHVAQAAEGSSHQFECYTIPDGSDYRGNISTTETGITCQKWTSYTPHSHDVTSTNYPDSGLGDHNFCRNPDGAVRVWCYTVDADVRWEFCVIGHAQASCNKNGIDAPAVESSHAAEGSHQSECYTIPDGSDYRGNISTTETGITCQKWTSYTPHSHDVTSTNYPDSGLGDHNYCRNPDGAVRVWCYTVDSDVRWEYCVIGQAQASCNKNGSCDFVQFQCDSGECISRSWVYDDDNDCGNCSDKRDCGIDGECYTHPNGIDYQGTVSTTETGKTCQKWTAQTPHKHGYTPAKNPDGGLGDHNYCRNPDGAEPRPWCYTIDSNVRWELCDVGDPQSSCGVPVETIEKSVAYSPRSPLPSQARALSILTSILLPLSIVCLVATIVLFIVSKLYKKTRIILHLNLSVSLLLAQLLFVCGIDAKTRGVCIFVTVMLHYLWLVACMWMLIEGMHVLKITQIIKRKIKLSVCIPFAWGVPAVPALIALEEGISIYGQRRCWLPLERGLIAAFATPALIISAVNMVFLVLIIRKFRGIKPRKKDKLAVKRLKSSIRSVAIVIPILALTCISLVLFDEPTIAFAYLFAICNGLQGVFIFLTQCVTDEGVYRFLLKKISRGRVKDKSNRTANGKSNSTANDKSNSTANDKSNSTAKDKSNSTAKDKSNSTAEAKSNSTAKDKSNSTANDKSNSTAEAKSNSTAKDKSNSTANEKSNSTAKDKSNNTANEKSNSSAEAKSNSTAKEKSNSTANDKSYSTVEAKSNSTANDKSNTTAKNKSKSTDNDK